LAAIQTYLMGWDACATINGEYFGIGERLLPSDAHLRAIFKVANDELIQIVGFGMTIWCREN
jgi:hypothetical protein